jgi:putative oxidoreductase
MLKRLFDSKPEVGPLLLRLGVGGVMFPHGAQKALGLWGGAGFSKTLESFETKMGIPNWMAGLVIAAEFLGAIGLVFGCCTRIAAAGMIAVMAGAIHYVHLKHGFFMNWFNNPQLGHGIEYHILMIVMSLVLVIKGGGLCSVDRWIVRGK